MTEITEPKSRVLVVDDEPRIVRFVRTSLTAFGYEVITASNGEEALQLVSSKKPDIMVLDIVMPGIDGFEVLKRLRTSSDLPVIVFSARSSNLEKARSLGADDFIIKPFLPEEMARRIGAVLDRKR